MAANDLEWVQRVVLGTLLEHRKTMLTTSELAALLPHHAEHLEVALTLLLNSGLATHIGEKWGVSHAAVRFDQLSPI